jgi:D-apionolactonase
MARGHVDAVCLSAPVGEFGVVHAQMHYPQPWFDQQGQGVYPLYHVIRGMTAAAGEPCLETALSDGSSVQAVAWRSGDATVLWLANLTGAAQAVEIEGLPRSEGQLALLDDESFVRATSGPDGFADSGAARPLARVELAPYAVARLTVRA